MTVSGAIAAVTAAIAALATALVALSRARPDRTRAWVGTAADLVEVSDQLVARLRVQAELDDTRVNRLLAQVVEQDVRIDSLAAQVEVMHNHNGARDAELSSLRETIRTERRTHHDEVSALSARVDVLEQTLLAHDIPVPPDQ